MIIHGIQESGLFIGEAGHMVPINSMQHLVDRAYYSAGQLVASVICQGGPSFNLLSEYLIEDIVHGKTPPVSEIPLAALELVVKATIFHSKL